VDESGPADEFFRRHLSHRLAARHPRAGKTLPVLTSVPREPLTHSLDARLQDAVLAKAPTTTLRSPIRKARASTYSSCWRESSPRSQSHGNTAFTTLEPILRKRGLTGISEVSRFSPSVPTTPPHSRTSPSSRQKSAPLSEKVGLDSLGGSIKPIL